MRDFLDFGVKLEKSVERFQKLLADFLFARTFDQMHGDCSLAAVLEGDGGIAHRLEFVAWQHTHAVNQRQLSHQMNISSSCVAWSTDSRRLCATTDIAARMPCMMPSTCFTGPRIACLTTSLACWTCSTVWSTAPSMRATC